MSPAMLLFFSFRCVVSCPSTIKAIICLPIKQHPLVSGDGPSPIGVPIGFSWKILNIIYTELAIVLCRFPPHITRSTMPICCFTIHSFNIVSRNYSSNGICSHKYCVCMLASYVRMYPHICSVFSN